MVVWGLKQLFSFLPRKFANNFVMISPNLTFKPPSNTKQPSPALPSPPPTPTSPFFLPTLSSSLPTPPPSSPPHPPTLLHLVESVTPQLVVPPLLVSSVGVGASDQRGKNIISLFRDYSALFLSILGSIFPFLVGVEEEEGWEEGEGYEEEEEGKRRWRRGVVSVFVCCLIYCPVRLKIPSLGMVKGLVGEGGGRKLVVCSSSSSSSSSFCPSSSPPPWWKDNREVPEWGGEGGHTGPSFHN